MAVSENFRQRYATFANSRYTFGHRAGIAALPWPGANYGFSQHGMGLPPVVVGVFISIILWRSWPLGFLELIYTPRAMILAQVVIAFPIVAGLTMSTFQTLDPNLGLQLLGIGASKDANVMDSVQGSALTPARRGDGRLRRSDLGSRGIHDGRRQYPWAKAGADDRDSARNEQG